MRCLGLRRVAKAFKGSRKVHAVCCQVASEVAGRAALEQGIKNLDVEIRVLDPAASRRFVPWLRLGIRINMIADDSSSHNGCRPKAPSYLILSTKPTAVCYR